MTSSQLVEEIERILLPKEFNEIRAALERIQEKKIEAVIKRDWQSALAYRDLCNSIKQGFDECLRICAAEVKPYHILQAIANLGFSEPIAVS